MKSVLAFLAAGCIALAIAACAIVDSPRKQYADAAATYQTALQACTDLAKAGKLTYADAQIVEAARSAGRVVLDQWNKVLLDPASKDADFAYWAQQGGSVVAQLLAVAQRYQATAPPK